MKVLYIATAYPRSETDVITPWLVETVNRLRAGGTDVTVFTSSYKGLGNQTICGAPVVRFRYFFRRWEDLTHDETAIDRVKRGLRYKFMAVCYLFSGMAAISRLCRRERFDIIHVHWPMPHSLFGWVASRACKAPVVISFHGAEVMAVRKGLKALRPFLRWAIKSADAVTANSSHTVKAIQEVFDRPVTIVPYGTTAGEAGPEDRGKGVEGSRVRVEDIPISRQSATPIAPPSPSPPPLQGGGNSREGVAHAAGIIRRKAGGAQGRAIPRRGDLNAGPRTAGAPQHRRHRAGRAGPARPGRETRYRRARNLPRVSFT